MGKMLVTYKKYQLLEFEVEAENFGDAKNKADIELNKVLSSEESFHCQESHWEAVECEVIEND